MSSTPVAHLFCVCANAMYFFLNKRTDNYSQILQNLFKKKNKSVRKEKEEKANDDGRPGKKCSMFLGSWNGLFNVPKCFFYNWINTLNIRANKEPLKMNYILKYNLLASRSKYAGNCSKCSSIWSFWKMFLRILRSLIFQVWMMEWQQCLPDAAGAPSTAQVAFLIPTPITWKRCDQYFLSVHGKTLLSIFRYHVFSRWDIPGLSTGQRQKGMKGINTKLEFFLRIYQVGKGSWWLNEYWLW